MTVKLRAICGNDGKDYEADMECTVILFGVFLSEPEPQILVYGANQVWIKAPLNDFEPLD